VSLAIFKKGEFNVSRDELRDAQSSTLSPEISGPVAINDTWLLPQKRPFCWRSPGNPDFFGIRAFFGNAVGTFRSRKSRDSRQFRWSIPLKEVPYIKGPKKGDLAGYAPQPWVSGPDMNWDSELSTIGFVGTHFLKLSGIPTFSGLLFSGVLKIEV